MSHELPDKIHLPGVAANVLLAAGAVLLKPALDSLLIPDSCGRIGDSKGLSLLVLKPAVEEYQQHDIVVPFLRTPKPIFPSTPLLQPSSMTAASGVMFGMTACFLFLVAAGTFLARSHTGSEPAGGGHSLSETLPYNREQRQAQNGRAPARRRSRRGPPDPMPPNNNQNNTPTEDIRPTALKKRLQVGEGIQAGAPPPPPPPPPGAVAVPLEDVGRKAVMNTLWQCLFGFSFIILFVKSISTSDCSYSQVDGILVDSDDTPSMPPNLLEPMEQHFPIDVPSHLSLLRPLLARFQVVHKAICGFVPTVFVSPCLFLRLGNDYLLCTLFCWILSSICALASGSACTGIHHAEEDEIIQVEVLPLSDQYIPQLPCESIPPQVDQLEDLENPEQVSDTPRTAVAEDNMVVLLPSEPGPSLADADPPTQIVERRCEDIFSQVDQREDLGNAEQVPDTPSTAVITTAAEDIMDVPLPSEPGGPGPSLADADPPTQIVERRVPPPGRTRRTRPRRHPNRPPRTVTDQAEVPVPS